MAGDWIKIEHGLPIKPEVMQIAEMLDIDECQVVGHLVRFWIWCDLNLSRNCPDVNGTIKGLDRVVGRDGFVNAMISVGWLTLIEDEQTTTLRIKNYDHHLSQSAKTRALEARKKQRQRANKAEKGPDNVPMSTGQKGGLEKRREENISMSYDIDNRESDKPDSEPISRLSITDVLGYWNSVTGQTCRSTTKRKKQFRTRCLDPEFVERWREAIDKACSSAFLMGENDRRWMADFEWFLTGENYIKILEGKYDGRGSGPASTSNQAKRHTGNMAALSSFLHGDDGDPGHEQAAHRIEQRAS